MDIDMRKVEERIWRGAKYAAYGILILATLPVSIPCVFLSTSILLIFLLPFLCAVVGARCLKKLATGLSQLLQSAGFQRSGAGSFKTSFLSPFSSIFWTEVELTHSDACAPEFEALAVSSESKLGAPLLQISPCTAFNFADFDHDICQGQVLVKETRGQESDVTGLRGEQLLKPVAKIALRESVDQPTWDTQVDEFRVERDVSEVREEKRGKCETKDNLSDVKQKISESCTLTGEQVGDVQDTFVEKFTDCVKDAAGDKQKLLSSVESRLMVLTAGKSRKLLLRKVSSEPLLSSLDELALFRDTYQLTDKPLRSLSQLESAADKQEVTERLASASGSAETRNESYLTHEDDSSEVHPSASVHYLDLDDHRGECPSPDDFETPGREHAVSQFQWSAPPFRYNGAVGQLSDKFLILQVPVQHAGVMH